MSEFLLDYVFFVLKSISIILIVLVVLFIFVNFILFKKRHQVSLKVEHVNKKYHLLQNDIEYVMLPKYLYKHNVKERKKKLKIENEKYKKLINKKNLYDDSYDKSRLFVLRFDGDIRASKVDNLREEINAILTVINEKKDEVLVILNSSGGMVNHYGLAAAQLKRIINNNINLTVSVDLVAASGGYMMACVASKIIAAPFSIVGSIGVLAQIPNFNKFLNKHDIDVEQHVAGKYKSTLSMFGKITDSARVKFREELDNTHLLFKKFVVENRKKILIETVSSGEYWYGSQALNLNLIDEIQTSDDYLFEKSNSMDIYEIKYVIKKGFKKKISNVIKSFL